MDLPLKFRRSHALPPRATALHGAVWNGSNPLTRAAMTIAYFGARRQPAPPPAPAAGGNTASHHPAYGPGCTVYTPGSACVPPTTHTAVNTRAPGACLVPRPAERVAAEAAEAAAAGTSM